MNALSSYSQMIYRGRFAPSPTGQLHFGSLVAAMGSYLDARHHDGEWLVRMEDLDQTREVAGSADDILRTLEAFGFAWHGEVIYQSARTNSYRAIIEQLRQDGLVYPCSCSRKVVAATGQQGKEGIVYAGNCRDGLNSQLETHALRLRVETQPIEMFDLIRGNISQNLAQEVGDFVIRRADGFHAYQLAVVVDDAWQQVTHVVRGADLLFSSPRQCYLQQLLAYPQPQYGHLPLVLDGDGNKLSKQSAATPVDKRRPLPTLYKALQHLGQELPSGPSTTLDEFWGWAIAHWSRESVPAIR